MTKKSATSSLRYSAPGSRVCSISGCISYDSCCVNAASTILVGCKACEPLKGVPKKINPIVETKIPGHCFLSSEAFERVCNP